MRIKTSANLPGEVSDLALDPVASRLYLTRTAPAPISILDARTLAPVTTFRLPGAPRSLAVDAPAGRLFVTTTGAADTVDATRLWVLNAASGSVLATHALPGRGAEEIVASPATGRVYVRAHDGQLLVADGGLRRLDTVALDGPVLSLAIHPADGRVYVRTVASLTILRAADHTRLAVHPLAGGGGDGRLPPLAVNLRTGRVYTATEDGLGVFDAATLAPIGMTPGWFSGIRWLAVSPTTDRVFADSAIIDGRSHQIVGSLLFSRWAIRVWADPMTDRLYAIDGADGIYTLHLATTATVSTIALGSGSLRMALNSRTHRIYGLDRSAGRLEVWNAWTMAHLASFAVGPDASALVVDERANRVYVAGLPEWWDATERTPWLIALDGATGAVVARALLGGLSPVGLAVDDTTGRVYVSDGNLNRTPTNQGIHVYDGRTLAEVGTISTSFGEPWQNSVLALAINPAVGRLYANDNGGLTIIDLSTGRLTGGLSTPGRYERPAAVNPRTGRIYSVDSNSLDEYAVLVAADGDDGHQRSISSLGYADGDSVELAVDAAANLVYALNWGSGTLTVLDGRTERVLTVFGLPYPMCTASLVVNPHTGQVIVTGRPSDCGPAVMLLFPRVQR